VHWRGWVFDCPGCLDDLDGGGTVSAGHTPGPWTLVTVKSSSGICHKIGPFPWKEDKQNHACIYVDYPNGAMGPAEAELKANAVLMTAAPELLAALIVLAENIEHAFPALATLGPLTEARAAIARALPTPAFPRVENVL
jgi:hypothetical protein